MTLTKTSKNTYTSNYKGNEILVEKFVGYRSNEYYVTINNGLTSNNLFKLEFVKEYIKENCNN
jgi:hypothetical protein